MHMYRYVHDIQNIGPQVFEMPAHVVLFLIICLDASQSTAALQA